MSDAYFTRLAERAQRSGVYLALPAAGNTDAPGAYATPLKDPFEAAEEVTDERPASTTRAALPIGVVPTEPATPAQDESLTAPPRTLEPRALPRLEFSVTDRPAAEPSSDGARPPTPVPAAEQTPQIAEVARIDERQDDGALSRMMAKAENAAREAEAAARRAEAAAGRRTIATVQPSERPARARIREEARAPGQRPDAIQPTEETSTTPQLLALRTIERVVVVQAEDRLSAAPPRVIDGPDDVSVAAVPPERPVRLLAPEPDAPEASPPSLPLERAPEIKIGRVRVELVAAPPAPTHQVRRPPAPARRAQPKHDNTPRTMLRFGIGQI